MTSPRRSTPALPRTIWLFAATLALSIGAVTIVRHLNFLAATYDMGFYVHDVWRIAHGHWTSSVFGFHVFADHFSPIMLLLAPVAYLSTAEGLLVVQALAVGSTAVPAFRLGNALGGSRLGWLCALWIGLSASVWHTVMYDFRPATLGFVALVWLIAELETEKRMWLIGVLCIFAASAREDLAVFAGIAVLIQSWFVRNRGMATVGVLTAGVGLWYTTFGYRLFAPFEYFLWYRYADYGSSPFEALTELDYAIPTAFARLGRFEVVVALAALLIPSLVVPAMLGIARSWPAFLIMLGNGISAAAAIPSIYYQYYIVAVVFLMWGAAHWMARPGNEKWHRSAGIATMTMFVATGPLTPLDDIPYGRSIGDVVNGSARAAMAEGLTVVPEGASVSAGNVLLPHLAERHEVFSFPLPMTCSEVIQRHTPRTSFPTLVVIEVGEAENRGVDMFGLGYELSHRTAWIEVWASTGRHPPSHICPSPADARQALFDQVARRRGA